MGFCLNSANGQDEDDDEREIDEPEGVVVEMLREDGSCGGAGKEGKDDAGKFAEFTQACFAFCRGEGVR